MPGVKGRSGGARRGAGRKPFVPTADQRNVVEMGSAFGLTIEQLALMVINPTTNEPIAKSTLLEQFRAELDRGHPKALLTVAGALYNNAVKHNNVTAQIFYLKTRGKWSEAPLDINATFARDDAGLDDIGERLVAAIARLRFNGSADESGDSEPVSRTTH